MNVTTAMTQINYAFRGTDDDPPTSGADFTYWLAVMNRKQSEWANDTKQNWSSLWSTDTVATVITSGQQTYNLGTTFLHPSDRVTVTDNGQTFYFTVCEPQEASQFTSACYVSGSNPKKLTFIDTIDANTQYLGGTITVPAYHTLADLTAGADTILVDDPYWLVYAVASELAFNELDYSDKAPDLNAKANALYQQMANNNRRGTNDNPRTARYNVNRIIDPISESGVGSN